MASLWAVLEQKKKKKSKALADNQETGEQGTTTANKVTLGSLQVAQIF